MIEVHSIDEHLTVWLCSSKIHGILSTYNSLKCQYLRQRLLFSMYYFLNVNYKAMTSLSIHPWLGAFKAYPPNIIKNFYPTWSTNILLSLVFQNNKIKELLNIKYHCLLFASLYITISVLLLFCFWYHFTTLLHYYSHKSLHKPQK